MTITKKKKHVLQCIARLEKTWGIPPAVREICKEMDLKSPGSMQKHIQTLEAHGYVEKTPGKNRSCKLTRKGWDAAGEISTAGNAPSAGIPLIGRIAAGTPILAEENKEDDLPVDPRLFGYTEAFALSVRGDSMKDAQIRDGDLAVIRPQQEAENGEIVAVMVDGVEPEATLKILRRNNGTVELHAANDAYAPLVFRGADRAKVTILGKLIGVIRRRP